MSNVIQFTGITRLDLDADRTLDNLKKENLEGFVLAGYTKDGQEFFCSTYADGGNALWLIERLKRKLLENGDAE